MRIGEGKEIGPRWSASVEARRAYFTPDGRSILTAGKDIRGLNAENGREVFRLPGGWDCTLSPDGRRLAVAETIEGGDYDVFWTEEGRIHLYDLRDATGGGPGPDRPRRVGTISAPKTDLTPVAFLRDGQTLVGWGPGGLVFWDLATLTVRCAIPCASSGGPWTVSPDERVLASRGNQASVEWLQLDNLQGGAQARKVEGFTGCIHTILFSPDGRRLITGSDEATFEQTGDRTWTTRIGDRQIKIWDVATGRVLHEFYGVTGWARALALSPDGRRLAGGCTDGTLRFWDAGDGRPLVVLRVSTPEMRCLSFSPDAARLALVTADGSVHLFDIATLLAGLE